jgi:hypothetical protein
MFLYLVTNKFSYISTFSSKGEVIRYIKKYSINLERFPYLVANKFNCDVDFRRKGDAKHYAKIKHTRGHVCLEACYVPPYILDGKIALKRIATLTLSQTSALTRPHKRKIVPDASPSTRFSRRKRRIYTKSATSVVKLEVT